MTGGRITPKGHHQGPKVDGAGAAVLMTRLGRKVFLGLRGRGYVELRPAEARGIALELARLAGEDDWTPPEVDE